MDGGSEQGQGLDGAVGRSRQQVTKIAADGDIEPSAAFDDREDDGDFWSGFLAA
jgi:hypothetical protein